MVRSPISTVMVRALSRASYKGHVRAGNLRFPCALGRTGLSVRKREGDGATPVGRWPMRFVFYRRDRIRLPRTGLDACRLLPDDGWCDAPSDRDYNAYVTHPHVASAERLWRDDGLYDVLIVLGYNDAPVVRGRGSAIFLHLARPGYAPTEGCIAISRSDMLRLLPLCGPDTVVVTH